MVSARRSLKTARLYWVLDMAVTPHGEAFDIFKKAVLSGVDVVQIRDKSGEAQEVLKFSKRAIQYLKGRIPFIVNDRADIALAAGADGVHVGQNDLDVAIVRKILGPRAVIGVSCQTWSQARKAQQAGADYIGFGSVFKTQTKPERRPMDQRLLRRVAREIAIPVFAIGGITRRHISGLKKIGVSRVAVTRAISQAPWVSGAVKDLRSALSAD